ncbi:hypothetical protein [Brevibacterium sp. VCM10]|uniref:hypothetical protein n=1 Tax=Brevibacterium sp. VCM10 TaxID=1381751 RepID=UPI001E4C3EF8|nr:hypothetical protein [Brevibacterium sp. VCM10]
MEVVFRVLDFAAAGAFSAFSAGAAAADEPDFVFGVVVLPAEVALEPLPPLAVAAPVLAVDVFDVLDLAVDLFDVLDLEVVDFVPLVFEAVDFDPAEVDADVLADDDFDADVEPVDVVSAVFVSADVDWEAVDDAVLEVEVLAGPDFGLRRRDDCIDAAGSVRAERGVFVSAWPSSVLPPEKKTSTGRSLEFASGINAPSPRPRPLFLRSATTYSSIRNFFSGFPVRQGTAGMWVV